MKLHPRTLPVKRAANEIGAVVLAYVKAHDPMTFELMHQFGSLLSGLAEDELHLIVCPDGQVRKNSLADQIQAKARECALTRAELWGIVGGEIQEWAKYALRHERHPEDPTQRADEA